MKELHESPIEYFSDYIQRCTFEGLHFEKITNLSTNVKIEYVGVLDVKNTNIAMKNSSVYF